MGKRKKPHSEDSGSEAEVERQTQEKAELVAAEPHPRPALFRVLQAVRAAVGAVLELADAVAEAVTKGLQPRS